MFKTLLLSLSLLSSAHLYAQTVQTRHITLSEPQIATLAHLIWQNEGAGKLENLSIWSKFEAFPSLGIGHFIWYPTDAKGPYIEQFPEMIRYLAENGVQLPAWLDINFPAPWETREAFYLAFDGTQLVELRTLLKQTTTLQAQFIIKRLERGIPAILNASSEQEKVKLNKNVSLLSATAAGTFALLDYINFKGEGISEKERYQGEGWGLKQVLLSMPEKTDNALLSFALSADEVLTRRVKNAPKNEINWLAGWRVRVHKYPLLVIQ